MQLRKIIGAAMVLISPMLAKAQVNAVAEKQIDTLKVKEQIEIDILNSYYDQDGNHSPVTGGRGTESLTDFTSAVIVNIPVGKNIYNIDIGFDKITSASTDNIDLDISSESKNDTRYHGNIGITHKISKRKSFSINAGASVEYDVFSFNGGGGYSWESKNRNHALDFKAQVFYDTWTIYRPEELSFQPKGETNRTTYNFSAAYSKVLSKKVQATLTAEVVYQDGLLATPFHRVFFNDSIQTDGLTEIELIKSNKQRDRERLPDSRIKFPVSLRVNYYVTHYLMIRAFYRFYYDDFGVYASTFDLELPFNLSKSFAIIPFYRLHTQTEADYFAPFGVHDAQSKYYTSDFDLSNFEAHHAGIGIRYAPLFGIFRTAQSKPKAFRFKSIQSRFAYYDRSDGLDAFIISLGLSFTVH